MCSLMRAHFLSVRWSHIPGRPLKHDAAARPPSSSIPCSTSAVASLAAAQLPALHHSPSAFHHTPPIPNQIAMLTTLTTAPNLHQSAIVT